MSFRDAVDWKAELEYVMSLEKQSKKSMTVKDLKAVLEHIPEHAPVEIEFRYKTGYDQGEIWRGPANLFISHDKVVLTSEGFELVGGW
jgi:hypothetical protein